MYFDSQGHSSLGANDRPTIRDVRAVADRVTQRLQVPQRPAGNDATMAGRPGSSMIHTSKVDELLNMIPDGFRFNDQMIEGVPNWMLYAGGAVVLMSALRKKK